MAVVDERLLLESDDVLLLESGDALLLELRQVIEAAGEHVGSLAQLGSHTAALAAVGDASGVSVDGGV